MRVPIIIRIGALVLATTAFYGYVGQLVPQKEVQPPPEIAIRSDLTTADMVMATVMTVIVLEATRRVLYIQPLGELTDTQRRIVGLTADFMSRYFALEVKVEKALELKRLRNELDYLRKILPSAAPAPALTRPSCY